MEELKLAIAEGRITKEQILSELHEQHDQWVSSWKSKGKLALQLETADPDIWEIRLQAEQDNLVMLAGIRAAI